MDASTSFGVGFTLNDCYAGWRLTEGWAADGRDIGWAETMALELAIYWLLQMNFHNSNITIRSDNTAVIDAFSNSKSCNPAWNNCLC